MKGGQIPKDLLYGELKEGMGKIGCPQLHFLVVVKKELKRTRINHTTWKKEAEDRSNWNSLSKNKILEGEVDSRNMMLKCQRRKACEFQPPLTFMSCPHCRQHLAHREISTFYFVLDTATRSTELKKSYHYHLIKKRIRIS